MGYRHYMYEVEKSLVEEIENMTREELIKRFMPEDDQEYFYHGNIPKEEIHELGKYIEYADQIQATGRPLFNRKETREALDEYDMYVIGKEGFLKLIKLYQKFVIDYYHSLLVDDDENDFRVFNPRTAAQKQEHHVQIMINEWERGNAVNMSEDREEITTSWKYEYAIFELIRKFKTFDFENKAILFYGW